MKYFPQLVVPLLLFLIALLLGAILWLQYTRGPQDLRDDRSARRERHQPWDPIKTPDDDTADSTDGEGDETGTGRTGRRPGDIAEVDPTITQEPPRTPPENELKPDLEAIETAEAKAEREKAEAQARLEATLARGAVLEQEQDGEQLNARVLWIVPKPELMGAVTPEDVNAFYCGPLRDHVSGAKVREREQWLASLGLDAKEIANITKDRKLLVGRIDYTGDKSLTAAAWKDLTRPPAVVIGLNRRVVANQEGWFAIEFDAQQWRESYRDGLRVLAPGWNLMTEDKPVLPDYKAAFSLEKDPASQKPVTIPMEPAPVVMLEVKCSLVLSPEVDLRAWLEVYKPRDFDRPQWLEPGLFIEANVPRSGVLTFVLPDPRTFGTASVQFGAAGDGWTSGTARIVEHWQDTRSGKPKTPAKYLRAKATVEMDRALTVLVGGTCLTTSGVPESEPVRVEAKQSGTRTWTLGGEFGLWVELTRGNWQQKLVISPQYARPFEFSVDYDVERPESVTLAQGASAPMGPWLVTLPARDATQLYLYFEPEIVLDQIRLVVPERIDRRVSIKPVAERPGFYRCDWPLLSHQSVFVYANKERIEVSVAVFPGAEALFAEADRAKDAWGRPLPVFELKRR